MRSGLAAPSRAIWLFAMAAALGSPTTVTAEQAGADPQLGQARRAVVEGRTDEALSLLMRLAGARPESSEVALWLGHAFKQSGDPAAATRQYLRAVQLDETNAGALISLGDMHVESGDLRRALDYYELAIEAAPEFPLGYRKAAGIEIQLVLHADAIAHLRRYVELRPGDIVARSMMGIEQYLDEDIDGAVATLEAALAIDPDSARVHFGLGMALADRAAEYDRALDHLSRAVKDEPENAMALYLIGKIHASRGDLEAAREALEASLDRDPAQPDAHYRIALVYARLGDRETAADHQQRFQELSRARDEAEELERRIGLLKEAAEIAMADEDLQRVRTAAEELASLAPEDADVLMVQARMALATGAIQGGLLATERALGLYPDHWEALYLHGVLLGRAGRLEESRDSLESAVAGNPQYAPALAALGNALMGLGAPEEARAAYESAVMLEPQSAAHYLNLAVVYGALGESELEARALATHRRLLTEQ